MIINVDYANVKLYTNKNKKKKIQSLSQYDYQD